MKLASLISQGTQGKNLSRTCSRFNPFSASISRLPAHGLQHGPRSWSPILLVRTWPCQADELYVVALRASVKLFTGKTSE